MVKCKIWPLAPNVVRGLLMAGLILAVFTTQSWAQEGEGRENSRLFITSSDVSSAPIVVLRAYGLDSQGLPLNLADEDVFIIHGDQVVDELQAIGDYKAGTFTIFIVDLPPGVASHLPAIQDAIQGYANPPNMEERIDNIVIYQVGESEANELLPPTNFYNTIRNFFADPLSTHSGPTALVDSIGNILTGIDLIKPKDDQFSSIVIFSDGTDPVSTQFEEEEIGALADELGIPIHTVWLENRDFQPFSHAAGRDYLAGLSARSRGVAARLDQPTEVQSIWDRISSFRNQQVMQYTIPDLTSGNQDVLLTLEGVPGSLASTEVTIPATAPRVTMNLPSESLELLLENLDSPITLSLSASVSWLDDIQREVASAELLVNGIPVQEIDVIELEDFTAEISIFDYGPNSLQVAITDNQGFNAISPETILIVTEGKTQVPEEIQAEGVVESLIDPFLPGCLIILLLLALAALLVLIVRRTNLLDRLPQRSEQGAPAAYDERVGSENVQYSPRPMDTSQVGDDQLQPTPRSGFAYLEMVHSVTRMPPDVELTAVEHRLGRSPVQADIVFENDITVSRLHATIVQEGSDYRIYDEGSTSGTLVNGQPVPDYGYQLLDGDEVILGDVMFRYRRT